MDYLHRDPIHINPLTQKLTSADRIDLDPIAIEMLVRTGLYTDFENQIPARQWQTSTQHCESLYIQTIVLLLWEFDGVFTMNMEWIKETLQILSASEDVHHTRVLRADIH